MVGWHHCLNGHEFEQTPGDSEGQGSLACYSPWGHKELDMTEQQEKKKKKTACISPAPNQLVSLRSQLGTLHGLATLLTISFLTWGPQNQERPFRCFSPVQRTACPYVLPPLIQTLILTTESDRLEFKTLCCKSVTPRLWTGFWIFLRLFPHM